MRVPGAHEDGWTISAISTLRSGAPLTFTTGSDTNVDGNSTDRVDIVGNPKLDADRSRSDVTAAWFNTAAFANPIAGADGNASRNLIDGPGAKWVDLGMFRKFQLKERLKIEFRAEMTNALNLVNLGNPTTGRNSSSFGKITGAGAMRQTQLGLRMSW